MRISVIGCGYLGAVHAAALASLGHEVIGVEVDEHRARELAAGRAPFFEPGLSELLAETRAASPRLTFTSRISDAAEADVHFVCVGTPALPDGSADLDALGAAFTALRSVASPGSVVVGKSTVPVGTAAQFVPQFASVGASFAWNPEFLREGHAIADTLSPDRIVVGVDPDSPRAEHGVRMLQEVYAPVLAAGTPWVVTDLATAELAKGAANAFLATKVSFMNMLAEVAEASGADITGLAQIMGLDPRIGDRYLNAGIGYGGGCLPKDVRAFVSRAEEIGAGNHVSLLREVDATNRRRPALIADRAGELLAGGVAHRRITILGAAFKPDSDDVRESPALTIAEILHARGAAVTVTDPVALDAARAKSPGLRYEPDLDAALTGAELLIIATEWAGYRQLDPEHVGTLTSRAVVLDGRNCLDRAAWLAAGWTYAAIGRGELEPRGSSFDSDPHASNSPDRTPRGDRD